jgi:hypothetical protein
MTRIALEGEFVPANHEAGLSRMFLSDRFEATLVVAQDEWVLRADVWWVESAPF